MGTDQVIETSTTMVDPMSTIKPIFGPDVPASPTGRSNSPAIRAGDFVFVSAQSSTGADGRIIPDTLEAEMRRAFMNIEQILAAAAARMSDIVQLRAYLDDPADLAEFNRLYPFFMAQPYPARTTLTGCLAGVVKFSADVIAYVPRPPLDPSGEKR